MTQLLTKHPLVFMNRFVQILFLARLGVEKSLQTLFDMLLPGMRFQVCWQTWDFGPSLWISRGYIGQSRV